MALPRGARGLELPHEISTAAAGAAPPSGVKVVVIGGGPAGLYFSLLHRKGRPEDSVVLLERNAPDATYGWGVVFSDATLEKFRAADTASCDAIVDNFAHWDDIDVHVKGRTITSGGHGFSGIARRTLLDILRRRAESEGVELRFGCEVEDDGSLAALGWATPTW